jgi:hypothetical protein
MLNFRHLVTVMMAVSVGTTALGQQPPAELKLTLPEYQVITRETLDYVMIPGGELLTEEEGRPLVPYSVEYLDCPNGWRVQDVKLRHQAEPERRSGLRLPVVILDMYRETPVRMKQGRYPVRGHTWRVVDVPGGGSRLAVAVYPFDYDPVTKEATYCREYEFDIKSVQTTVELADIATDKHSYSPAEVVNLTAAIGNAGAAQDLFAAAVVLRASTGDTVGRLKRRTVTVPAGSSAVTLEWPSKGTANGDYFVDVTLSDGEGIVLDRGQAGFRLGIPAGEQSGFQVEPQHFRLGDDVGLSLSFKNTGSTALTGQAMFEVRLKDSLVAEMRSDFEGLAPGRSRRFSNSWNTVSAEKNALYEAVGYVLYEATATPAEQAIISTNAAPSAEFMVEPDTVTAGQEVQFDASGSKDPDGTVVAYRWDFGDGGKAEGVEATHVYPEPGEFVVTLVVTDDGGRPASAEKAILVGE